MSNCHKIILKGKLLLFSYIHRLTLLSISTISKVSKCDLRYISSSSVNLNIKSS